MALIYGNPTMPSCAFTQLRVSQPKRAMVFVVCLIR
jgi:hypothetical protein